MNRVKLEEICTVITDGSHNPPKGIDKSEFLMLSSKNVYDDSITYEEPRYLSADEYEQENKRTNITAGDVLLTIVGTVGRCAVVPENCGHIVLQRSVSVLKPRKDMCNSRYLMYALIAKRAYFEAEARGVAQKGIYLKQLSQIEIPVPNLQEQNDIIRLLDKVQSIITARKQQLIELDNLIKARFVEMFGDPVSNTLGWNQEMLCDVTSKIGSGATPKGGKESYQTEGITLIRSMNVHDGRFEYKDLAHLTEEQAAQLDNVTVEEHDVFINITGASVARSCIVPSEVLPARVNQHVAIIRCIREKLHPTFANNMFLNDRFKGQLLDIGESGGATRQAITKQQLEMLTVILPPMELQEQFAAFIQQTDKSKVVEAIHKTNTLFNTTLNGGDRYDIRANEYKTK